jgi:hypothetical protein
LPVQILIPLKGGWPVGAGFYNANPVQQTLVFFGVGFQSLNDQPLIWVGLTHV